jgi:hypothetical protein
MKVRIVILIFSVFSLASFCKEDCDNLDKEEISIGLWTDIIDSIKIITPIKFIISQPLDNYFSFRSGAIKTDEKVLEIEVYVDGNSTFLDIPIKEDSFLAIVLSHSLKDMCSDQITNSLNTYEIFNKNDIVYCYYHQENQCP